MHIVYSNVHSDDGSTTKDVPAVLTTCNEASFKSGTRIFHPTEQVDSFFMKSDVMGSDDLDPSHPTNTYVTSSTQKVNFVPRTLLQGCGDMQ